MSQEKKRTNVETEAPFDERPAEGVTNDSLGTVDPSDSSGLDDEEGERVEKPAREGAKSPGVI